MRALKGFQKLAMVSAVAVLGLSAASAYASNGGPSTNTLIDGVFQAHVGASILGTTAIVENDAVSFGNLKVTSPAVATTNFAMSSAGLRAAPSGAGIVLLDGGVNGGTGALDDVYGAARPGSYTITGDSGSTIYVTYFVDDNTGTFVSTDNSHPIHLTHAGSADLLVYNLTDNGHHVTVADNDPYAGDAYSSTVLTGGTATLTVGGTLEATNGGTYLPGPYRGTFDIMVHY